ncbi:MAG: hypothetical protein ACI8X5_004176 [Planctomycetota bacterium]|jgi:hypothetical protein
MSLRRVRKRDGTLMPFDKKKIAAAVRSAQNAVGEHDPLFADEVAELVELTLRRRYAWRGESFQAKGETLFPESERGELQPFSAPETTAAESIPEIEEIQDLAEIGLVELGRAAVAKAYILYRDRRTRARDSLSTTASREEHDGQLRHLRVREAQGTYPWSKARIIAALVQEAELSREQAEAVALRVEARVVASGLKRITTALIRELVDNELVAMGLSGALARQAPVAVPRYDLRELLARGAESPSARRAALDLEDLGKGLDAGRVLGGELLSRFALADQFSEASAECHLSAALHIEDLRAPHLYLTQGVRSDLLLRGAPGAHAAFDALDEVASSFGGVARGIVLENSATLLAALARPGRGEDHETLGTWLLAAGALARGAGRRLDLASPGAKAVAFCARLVRVLDELYEFDDSKSLPRLYLDRGELHGLVGHSIGLRPALSRLLGRGALIPTWAPESERFVGPAGRRQARELGAIACGGAVSLNLARVARQAGPWREDLALEGFAHLVEEGIEALSSLARFQREVRSARAGEVRGRVAYSICPVGLGEALRLLGDGELRADQGARVLGLLSEAARRFSAARGLSVQLSPHYGREAAERFALADSQGARSHQGLLFTTGANQAGAMRGEVREYSRGYRLGNLPGTTPGQTEAHLLATVPVGSWLAFDSEHGARYGALSPHGTDDAHLSAWELFESERASIRQQSYSAHESLQTAPFFSVDSSTLPSSPRAS